MFDEKYNALLGAGRTEESMHYPSFQRRQSMQPMLGFDAILMQMDAAAQPGIGELIKPDDQARLETAGQGRVGSQ